MLSMQQFPVNNMRRHSAPLLGYLRLLGIERGPGGELFVGGDGAFESEALRVSADGHGSVRAVGPMRMCSRYGLVDGRPGTVSW